MEQVLFEHEKFERLYNCSAYDVDDIPLAERRQTLFGTIHIVLSIVFEIIYIPCVFAISKHLKYPSFKFMFFIGIIDIIALPIIGTLNGIMAVNGVVYCSAPALVYANGILGSSFYFAESWAAIFLALNRCIENFSPHIARALFYGKRAWYWLMPIFFYVLSGMWFEMPTLWNSHYFTWMYNPHAGYIEDYGEKYHFYQCTFHNSTVFVILTSLNLIFCFTFPSRRFAEKKQKIPFAQLFLITFINMIGTAIFVVIQFIPVPYAIIASGHFLYLFVHGLPGVIYITANQTIRRECLLFLNWTCGLDMAVGNSTASQVSHDAPRNNTNRNNPSPISQISKF